MHIFRLGATRGLHFRIQRDFVAHDALQVVEHSNRKLALFHDQERRLTRLRAPSQYLLAAVVRPKRGKICQLKFGSHALKKRRTQSSLQNASKRRSRRDQRLRSVTCSDTALSRSRAWTCCATTWATRFSWTEREANDNANRSAAVFS